MSSRVMTRSRSSRVPARSATRTLRVRSLPLRRDHDLLLHEALAGLARLLDERRHLGQHRGDRLPEQFLARRTPRSASVDGLTMVITPSRVDADDARRNAREHRFREAAAAVDEIARGGEAVMLAAQLRRHLVEGFAEMGEIALAVADRHLDIEIARRDLVGRVDEAADRRDQPVGEVEPEPDRGQKHDQRDQREHRARRRSGCPPSSGRAPRRPPTPASAIGGNSTARRIDLAGDVTGCGRHGLQLQDGAEDVAGAREEAKRFRRRSLPCRILRRRWRQVRQRLRLDLLDRPCRPVRESSPAASRGRSRGMFKNSRKTRWSASKSDLGAVEVVRHELRLAGKRAALRFAIGRGRSRRCCRRAPRSELGEPRLETALEGDGGDDGDEDRRQHRDEAEERDDPDMQPGRCGAGPPLAHQAARLPGHDPDQEEDEGGIDRERRRMTT